MPWNGSFDGRHGTQHNILLQTQTGFGVCCRNWQCFDVMDPSPMAEVTTGDAWTHAAGLCAVLSACAEVSVGGLLGHGNRST